MVHAKLQAVLCLYAAAVLLLISTAVTIDAIALLRVIVHADKRKVQLPRSSYLSSAVAGSVQSSAVANDF